LLDLPALLDAHAFDDAPPGLGRVACDLGNAYLQAGSLRPNASALFWLLIRPERAFSPPGMTRLGVELRALVERDRSNWLERNRPGGLDDSARRLERLADSLSGREPRSPGAGSPA
jgi:hypothetical protein